jgi:hypothetical protein
LKASDILGALLVLIGLLVPSATWPELVRASPLPPEAALPLGGQFFGIGLVLLGVFIIVGCRLDLWRPLPMLTHETIHPPSHVSIAALCAILLLGGFLRLYALESGLWLDEIVTQRNYVSLPFGDVLTSFSDQNQHLLYTLMARASVLAFGDSSYALRLPAALFGLGSLCALYLFARRVTTDQEALIATALMAFSYHHIWFSQNARGYTGLLFWTLLASWFFLRALTEPRRRLWLLYACAVTLGLYTHLTMAFLVAAQFLIFLGIVMNRRWQNEFYSLAPVGAGFLLSALLTYQLYALVLPQILGPVAQEVTTVASWNSPLWALLELIRGLRLDVAAWLSVPVAVAIVGAGCVSYLSRQFLVPLFLVLPAVLISAVTISMGHPLWPRFFFFLAGFGVLVFIRGIRVVAETLCDVFGWTRRQSLRFSAGVATFVVLASGATIYPVYGPKQDFEGAKEFIQRAQEPGEPVVVVGIARYALSDMADWHVARTAAEVESILDMSSRVWMIYAFEVEMETTHPDILKLVREQFQAMGRFDGSLAGGSVFVFRSHTVGSKVEKQDVHDDYKDRLGRGSVGSQAVLGDHEAS